MSELERARVGSTGDGEALRVLLVEDNPGDVRLVQEALANNSIPFSIDTATRVSDLEEGFDASAYDVVLLDLGLPDSTGIETFERVHELLGDTPIVILSVLSDEDVAVRAVRAGAQDYLLKDELPVGLLSRAVRYSHERHLVLRGLRDLAQELRTFIAHAAHDLRTPVATVAGFAELLSQDPDTFGDRQLDDLVDAVRGQARRLEELVRDLLDLAKVHERVELGPIDLEEVVKEAVSDAPPPAHVSLDTHLVGALMVHAHHSRLERLVTNLLTNGYRYGGDAVRVSGSRANGVVALCVEDAGPGVPADVQATLFEAFTQGSNSQKQGTGLGLSIVRQIAESFGGSVSYERSRDLGGARFEVILPAASAVSAE